VVLNHQQAIAVILRWYVSPEVWSTASEATNTLNSIAAWRIIASFAPGLKLAFSSYLIVLKIK
jgi:hypothetical protein